MILKNPPPEVSAKVLEAIRGALQEEKTPASQRWLRVLFSSTACTLILALPLLLTFRDQWDVIWMAALIAWWLCFGAGFYLYYRPQPRLAVPGFWSPWIFAKVLLVMTVLTCLEILICPSFVFLESPLSWSPLEGLSHVVMAWGGMQACMLFCGFLFSSLGGIVTFSLISKTLRGSLTRDLLVAVLLAYATQLPVIGIQLWEAELRPFVLFWALGAALGTWLTALFVRFVTKSVMVRTQR